MYKTNLAIKNDSYTIPVWDYIVSEITKVFSLSDDEKVTLYNSKTARLIATIPFEAECKEPERTAIAHICIYEAEIKGFQKYFSHQPFDDEDIFNRLAFISTFEGGNKKIIEHGMYILAYIMLQGYYFSKDIDLVKKTYNPITSGAWNYKSIKTQLLEKINELYCPALDQYFTQNITTWKS